MAFNISTFRSQVSEKGLLPTNKFMVVFNTPKALLNSNVAPTSEEDSVPTGSNRTIATQMNMYCDSVGIPGMIIQQNENRRYGYGPSIKMPFGGDYITEVPMSIMIDGNGDNYRFMRSWMQVIWNHDNRRGVRSMNGIVKNQYPFEIAYMEEYTTNIDIYVYNNSSGDAKESETSSLILTMREAYPVAMQDIPLNWADNNNIMRLPIIFTCHYIDERTLMTNKENKS
jgi:hypothetical protein